MFGDLCIALDELHIALSQQRLVLCKLCLEQQGRRKAGRWRPQSWLAIIREAMLPQQNQALREAESGKYRNRRSASSAAPRSVR